MLQRKQLVFIIVFVSLSFNLFSQNKYALLVGICDYYEVKGVKSNDVSLSGCVNDADSIKKLLITKFGFNNTNIKTVYNEDATRDNIIAGMKQVLQVCKPGDAFVFFYSGHGVWMNNSQNLKDSVKHGFNQAMLTSDLYNFKDNFKCFFRDTTLKKYFNLFIDKKVILTALLDCCYSGSMDMASNNTNDLPSAQNKSVDLDHLMYILTKNANDPQKLIDSISGVSANNSSDNSFNSLLHNTLNNYDSVELVRNKSALFAQRIVISDNDKIVRPVTRQNSKYLFISAATDMQEGQDIPDKNKNYHGLFTNSIISVFNQNPASITVDEVFNKINLEMKSYIQDNKKNVNGLHDQNPQKHLDPSRNKTNLFGVKLTATHR